MLIKFCPNCERDLPHENFNRCATKPSGLQSWCKECKSESSKKRLLRDDVKEANRLKSQKARQDNPEKVREAVRKSRKMVALDPVRKERAKKKKLDAYYQSTYGLTTQQVEDMKCAQAYKCALCGDELGKTKDSHVDHNHTTGKVREVLCHHCNLGIGLFKESEERLQKAIEYLRKHA